ncbi:exo-alpha-sialidase [bacterium]|nr:exo-alpha-sialidase [bacterium]
MNNRRKFITQLAAGSLAAPTVLRAAQNDSPSIRVLETKAISQEPQYYNGWPTVARRKNGELVVVWSGGRESHVCPFGQVEMMISRDEGRNWSWPRVLLDTDIDDRDSGVLETSKGTLLVTTFTSLAYESILQGAIKDQTWPPERLAAWLAVDDRLTVDERKSELGQWMIRSEDGGRTWSTRYRCIVNSPHGPIQLRGGDLLYAGKALWTGAGRVGCCRSTDDGKTWEWLATLPTRKGDEAERYHELHAVETRSGKLIIHIRNENSTNANETLQSESTDVGKTWSVPHTIGVWGLPSHLLRLRDDRLLMTYGYRRPPFGNQARISSDEGDSWSAPLVISDDGAGGDLGYPSTVELAHGELLTVWYENPGGSAKAVLRQARWQLGR